MLSQASEQSSANSKWVKCIPSFHEFHASKFSKKFLGELPFVGPFFEKKTYDEGLEGVIKCFFRFGGGIAAMMYLANHKTDDGEMSIDNTHKHDIFKQIFSCSVDMTIMLLGMTGGKLVFNAVRGTGSMLYGFYASQVTDYPMSRVNSLTELRDLKSESPRLDTLSPVLEMVGGPGAVAINLEVGKTVSNRDFAPSF